VKKHEDSSLARLLRTLTKEKTLRRLKPSLSVKPVREASRFLFLRAYGRLRDDDDNLCQVRKRDSSGERTILVSVENRHSGLAISPGHVLVGFKTDKNRSRTFP